jgi:hypothetical protein
MFFFLSVFVFQVSPVFGDACGALYTDPCYSGCQLFDTIDPVNPCYVNCTEVTVYDDFFNPCYLCDAAINCDVIGGICVDDPVIPCSCNYGFTNNNCSEFVVAEDDPAYLFLVWFLGVGCMAAMGAYSLGLLIFQLLRINSWRFKNIFHLRNLPILSTVLCFSSCAFGLFYFVPDAYARHGIRVGCSSWIMDFFCAYFAAMAFCCVTWQWIVVVSSLATKRPLFATIKTVLKGLKVFIFVDAIVLLCATIAASVLSCVCDDVLCPYVAQDYLFWISWLTLNGIAILVCMSNAIVVIVALHRFKMRHRRRIRLFTGFIIAAGCGMLMMLGFGISFFLSYAATREGFLAAECLFQAFIDVIILSILLLLTFTRGHSGDDDAKKMTSKPNDPPSSQGGMTATDELSGLRSPTFQDDLATSSSAGSHGSNQQSPEPEGLSPHSPSSLLREDVQQGIILL